MLVIPVSLTRADALAAYRELISFRTGTVTAISIVPDFGWLLVLVSGALLAFNLQEIIPTSEPSTWIPKVRSQGLQMSQPDHNVAFARVGTTKGRTLGGCVPPS